MKSTIPDDHPLYSLFRELVHNCMRHHLGPLGDEDVERYLTALLVEFSHTDSIFAIQDLDGHHLEAVTDMLEESDVLLNADSFEREREVHKHIGDFILFWAGIYPGFLSRLRARYAGDLLCDYLAQGKRSYHVVSTFDHEPFAGEAPTFRKLSMGFEEYTACLSLLREALPLQVSEGGSA